MSNPVTVLRAPAVSWISGAVGVGGVWGAFYCFDQGWPYPALWIAVAAGFVLALGGVLSIREG